MPAPVPDRAAARPRSSRELRTWDTSFVREQERRGPYRMHLRESAPVPPMQRSGLQERFEYVVSGPPSELETWLSSLEEPFRARSAACRSMPSAQAIGTARSPGCGSAWTASEPARVPCRDNVPLGGTALRIGGVENLPGFLRLA